MQIENDLSYSLSLHYNYTSKQKFRTFIRKTERPVIIKVLQTMNFLSHEAQTFCANKQQNKCWDWQ